MRFGLLAILAALFVGCNDPIPVLKIKEVTDNYDGTLSVKYKLRIVDGSDCSVEAYFSVPGSGWVQTTSTSSGTEGLAASDDWTEHTYSWKYADDLGPGRHKSVRFKLLPYADTKGRADTAGPMDIGEPLVAVCLNADDAVALTDPVEQRTVAAIPAGDDTGTTYGPKAVAVTPDGAVLLVADETAGVLSVLAVDVGAFLVEIPVGGSPAAVCVHPSGTEAYVANSADGTISVVDVTGLTVVRTIAVGDEPVALAVSPSGNVLYVANRADDTVGVVDLTVYQQVTTFAVDSEPTGLAITSDNYYLLVACRAANKLQIFDTSDLSTPAGEVTVGQGPSAVAVTHDGFTAFVANHDDATVSFVDLDSFVLTDSVSVGTGPAALAVSAGDRYLYVSCGGDDNVAQIDISSASKKASWSVGSGSDPAGIAALPE